MQDRSYRHDQGNYYQFLDVPRLGLRQSQSQRHTGTTDNPLGSRSSDLRHGCIIGGSFLRIGRSCAA